MRRSLALRPRMDELLLLAYTIPPERVRPLMTHRLVVDKWGGPGLDQAVVVTSCARLSMGRPGSLLGRLPLFIACHYTCVKREDTPAVFVFRTILSPPALAAALRLAVPSAQPGAWSPEAGWRSSPESVSPPQAAIHRHLRSASGGVEIEIIPSSVPASLEDVSLKDFLMNREQFFFWLRGRYLWKIPVEHPQLSLHPAHFSRARLPFWQKLGLVSDAEVRTPAGSFLGGPTPLRYHSPRPDLSL